jgi:hypothetical protein
MDEITANVNWIAVIVGAVLAYLLGWLWYSPKLFGRKWAEGVGLKSAPERLPIAAMTAQAIGTFLLSWVVGVTAANNALLTVILVVATIVALMLAGSLFTLKSSYAMLTEAGFVVAMAVVMIAVQGIL